MKNSLKEKANKYLKLETKVKNLGLSSRFAAKKQAAKLSIELSELHSEIADEFFYSDRIEAALYIKFREKYSKKFTKNNIQYIFCKNRELNEFVISSNCEVNDIDNSFIIIGDGKYIGDFGTLHQEIVKKFDIVTIEYAKRYFDAN